MVLAPFATLLGAAGSPTSGRAECARMGVTVQLHLALSPAGPYSWGLGTVEAKVLSERNL